jgi:hypothetical protein
MTAPGATEVRVFHDGAPLALTETGWSHIR